MGWNDKGEMISGSFPVATVGFDGNVKGGQVVGVGEVDGGDLASVEFGNV